MNNSWIIKRRKKEQPKEEIASWWRSPYIIGSGIGILVLVGIFFYHFFIAAPVISDKPTGGESDGFFGFLKKGLFAKKPPIDMSNEELDALGIATASRKAFTGAAPENYRDQRRIFALQKIESIRHQNDERFRENALRVEQRSKGSGLELKEAVESMEDSESLGIMKLESLVQRESNQEGISNEKVEMLIYACQMLGDAYAKKQMKEKSRDVYLTMFKLLKERAPEEQGPQHLQAISEFEKSSTTSGGN
ncbi:MAG: hypothetical protein HQM08_13520 [Candidatus Riflebacteria bacterium]|nr:hypothetical protein [Candidatus Riflebacteria bacterium]